MDHVARTTDVHVQKGQKMLLKATFAMLFFENCIPPKQRGLKRSDWCDGCHRENIQWHVCRPQIRDCNCTIHKPKTKCAIKIIVRTFTRFSFPFSRATMPQKFRHQTCFSPPRGRELQTQKLMSHLVKTQSLNVLPLKPGVGQYIAIHAALTARDFFLISTLPVHTPAFFSKTSPDFSYAGCD